jgi:hypothetical protein
MRNLVDSLKVPGVSIVRKKEKLEKKSKCQMLMDCKINFNSIHTLIHESRDRKRTKPKTK